MKFNKLFFAAVAFATLAMVSCKKDEPTPVIPTPDDEEVVPECPVIDAPGAGKTTIAIYAEVCPRGAYLVGTFQENKIDDDAAAFEAVPNAEHWYAVTIDYADDLAVKAIARPSDEEVAYNWSYQWGLVYDANHPSPAVAEDVEDTKVLAGAGTLVSENNCEVKLTKVANDAVVYVWVKNWKASPIIEAKKLETCWAKSSWDGGDWYWKEMTAKGDGVFELNTRWGGNGINIAETENGADVYYENPELIDGPKAGDSVCVTFVSEKMNVGKLSIKLLQAGERPQFEVKDVTVTGIVPEGWTKCYIWAWGGEKDENYTGGQWPGEELTIDGGKVTKAFKQVNVPMKVIFSNGDGAQTKDITGITEDIEINIAENLK